MYKEGSCSSVWAIPPLREAEQCLQEVYLGLLSARKTPMSMRHDLECSYLYIGRGGRAKKVCNDSERDESTEE